MNNILVRARSAVRRIKLLRYLGKSPQSVFTHVYANKGFGGTVSASGAGSDLLQTATVRELLPSIVNQFSIRTLLDAPCGDFYWMNETKLQLDHYYGADVVPSVIQRDTELYGSPERTFFVADLTCDKLPQVDMIFCRDCLVHLSLKSALAVLKNIALHAPKYILTTTFPTRKVNKEIITGSWRPINLQLEPFSLPEPLMLVTENCTEGGGRYSDKSMALWSGEQLKMILQS